MDTRRDTRYTLESMGSGIYCLRFERHYDCCMHFLRFQEYYESPEFKGEAFSLLDFMDWYAHSYSSHKHDKRPSFTYPSDWAGFNVPRGPEQV